MFEVMDDLYFSLIGFIILGVIFRILYFRLKKFG